MFNQAKAVPTVSATASAKPMYPDMRQSFSRMNTTIQAVNNAANIFAVNAYERR